MFSIYIEKKDFLKIEALLVASITDSSIRWEELENGEYKLTFKNMVDCIAVESLLDWH